MLFSFRLNGLSYFRKLTLVLIKVLEINANLRKYHFQRKSNAKEVLNFQNEGNQRDLHKDTEYVETSGTNIF